jgi:hypothetical protein
MTAAIGRVEDNGFIKQVRKETDAFKTLVESMMART